ncbi:hypothetical protein EB73_33925 [Mycobacterium sp. SWH-M3]|nr:hypothetical protein EB73_33925 [Mycobacterium sp. SWH-M3]
MNCELASPVARLMLTTQNPSAIAVPSHRQFDCRGQRRLAEPLRFNVVDRPAARRAIPAALGAHLKLPALMLVSPDIAPNAVDE